MVRMTVKNISPAILCFVLASCSGHSVTEYHEGTRDNVIDGTDLMVSIDDHLPPINSFATPVLAGDTLIILDYRSTDLLCTAYDIYNDSTIGRFGKYGAGPGEVGNPLFRFYDRYGKNLYIGNGNRGKLSYFHLPEAISDTTYGAVDRLPIDFTKGILYPQVIDESTILCTTYPDLSNRVSRISTLNLETGEITVIDTVSDGKNAKFGIAVSQKDNLIFSVDKQHDMIRLLGLDGTLRGIVYGPEYDENAKDNEYYFSVSEICGDKVASIYTGKDSKIDSNKIILTDLNGRYLKTLLFDATVWGIQYHDKTDRLYLTTKGEPQIGYIELDKIHH